MINLFDYICRPNSFSMKPNQMETNGGRRKENDEYAKYSYISACGCGEFMVAAAGKPKKAVFYYREQSGDTPPPTDRPARPHL